MIDMTATPKMISAPELAETLGTNGKDLRAFLRSTTPRDAQPGKGGRWALPGNAKAIAAFRKGYAEWEAKRDADRAARAAEKAATTAQIAESTDDELDALAAEIMAPEDDEDAVPAELEDALLEDELTTDED